MLAAHQRYDGVELLGLFKFKKICCNFVQVNGLAHYTDPTIQHQFGYRVAVEQYDADRTFSEGRIPRFSSEATRSYKYSMVVLALNRSAQPIDIWATDGIVGPTLGLKCGLNAYRALPKVPVAIDSPIAAPFGY